MDTTNTMIAGDTAPAYLFGFALDNLAAVESSYLIQVGAPWFEVDGGTSRSIVSGGDDEIYFRGNSQTSLLAPGVYTSTISVTRLSDGDVLQSTVSLFVEGGNPQASVRGLDGTEIAAGSQLPTLEQGTRFPIVSPGASLSRTFQIRNVGTGPLSLEVPTVTISGDPAFTVASQPSVIGINGGSQVPFVIQFAPPDTILRQATVTVRSGDTTNPNYTFVVRGGGADPSLSLTGGGVTIVNGDTGPALVRLTDFGPIDVNLPHTITRTYVVTNSGTDAVALGPVAATPASNGFSGRLSSTFLEPGATALLRVDYQPNQPVGVISGTISLTAEGADAPIFSFAVRATNVDIPKLVSQPSNALDNSDAWLELGAPNSSLVALNLGRRYYDSANNALAVEVFPNALTRAVGWYESENLDLPYSSVGPNSVVRATYDLAQTGPGSDRGTTTTARKMPNFRLRVMQRFVLNAMMEIGPNDAGADPAIFPAALELAPSQDLSRPSRYYVDIDPVDVPFLTGATSATEGVQRGFEAVAEVNSIATAGSGIEGVLLLMASSLSTYPDPGRTAEAVKVYGDNPFDFTNNSININRFQLEHDPLALGQVVGFTTATQIDVSRGVNGITVSTNRVSSELIAVAAFDFLEGNAFDVGRPDAHLRVDPERLYKVSALISANNRSENSPQIRLRARSVKFQWNMKLELGGAKTIGSQEGLTLGAQFLPGVGSQNPDVNISNGARWYHMYVSSPLDPNIRPDVAGGIAAKFPVLSAQPGMGDPAADSFRNLRLGWDVIDSFSYGPGFRNEVADTLILRRIEIRSLPQPGTSPN